MSIVKTKETESLKIISFKYNFIIFSDWIS